MLMSAFLWAVVTACVWGIVPVMEKVGIGRSEPLVGVCARSVGVVAGLVLVTLVSSPWKAVMGLSMSSFLLLALGGFLASFVGQFAFYHALRLGHVSQVTPVAGAYPLIAAWLGWLILREPMTPGRWAGVTLIIAGVLFLRR